MNPRVILATGSTALLAVLAPVATMADTDPVTQLNADVAKVSADIKSAHDTLLADLAKVTTDVGKGDKAAAKADMQQFRTDRTAAIGTIQADRDAVKADLQAVRAAKAGSKDLATALKAQRDANKAALDEVHAAAQQTRDALKALAGAGRTGGTPPAPPSK